MYDDYNRDWSTDTLDNTTRQNIREKVGYISSEDGTSFNIIRKLTTGFNRYKLPIADMRIGKSFSYVFFTKPDLHIFDSDNGRGLNAQTSADPLYVHMYKESPAVLQSLGNGTYFNYHSWLPLLSNHVQSFDVIDEMLESGEFAKTRTGFKVKYGKSNIQSQTGGEFSVEYEDNKQFLIYKIHKIWTDYISKVYRGEFLPTKDNILNKIIDYGSSCYYFLTGEDGSSIIYWEKYTGIFPVNTSANMATWAAGSPEQSQKLNISYSYSFRQQYDPFTLVEFNKCSNVTGNTVALKTFDPSTRSIGPLFAARPFVATVNGTKYQHKLKFI